MMKAQSFLYVMIFLYALLLAYLTLFLGSSNDGLIGSQHFFTERIIDSQSLLAYDDLSFGGSIVPFTPTTYLLKLVSFIPLSILPWILLVLIFSLLVVSLQKLGSQTRIFTILVLFFSSPIFVISLLSLSEMIFILLFFGLFFSTLYVKKLRWLSYVFAAILGLYGVGTFVVVSAVILFNPLNNKQSRFLLVPVIVGFLAHVYLRLITNSVIFFSSFNFPIVEFGQVNGFSLLLVLLVAISTVIYYNKISGKQYICAVIIVITTLFFSDLFLFAAVLFSIVGSYSLSVYFDKKWSSLTLHISSLVVLVLLFVFSQIFIFQAISLDFDEQSPNIFVEELMVKDGLIFSSHQEGYFIESLTYPTFWNSQFTQISDQSYEDTYYDIVSNYSLSGLSELLVEENISYIYITPRMREEAQSYLSNGFLLPLSNNDSFSLISSRGEYALYKVE